MSTITSLKLGSVPITEEGVERYRFSDNVENHFTKIYERSDDLNCSVGRVFSKMKVPVSWFEVMNANYLIADMEINNPSGSTLHIKGWIDAIDLLSDSDDYPLVEIRWHFDYYEMYKSTVNLGYGHVKRRPFRDIDTTPIQDYPMRYLQLDGYSFTVYDLIKTSTLQSLWWVIFSDNHSTGTSTVIRTFAYPIFVYTDQVSPIIQFSDGTTGSGPNFNSLKIGLFEDYMGIAAEELIGVWLSPIAPFDVQTIEGSGVGADPIIINKDSLTGYSKIGGTTLGIYKVYNVNEKVVKSAKTITGGIISNEQERYILTDTGGQKILDLPYGMEVSSIATTLVIEPDGPYIEFSFKDSSYGNTEGMAVNIPLTSFPINENAFNAYVYSGQREYDKNMRNLMSTVNAWKSVSAGAGTGAMMGAFGPKGLLIGALSGATGGLVSYGVEMGYQNDKEQAMEDRLKAQQIPSLLLSSNSFLAWERKYSFVIKKLVMDTYSDDQLINTRNNFGVSVDEILSSCDYLVRTELPNGYYSIKNLIISGAAPKEAKDYIKNKFDAGVKLL